MLEIKKLFKSYNGRSVLKNITLKVEEGEFLSIIGPSGAGKSTLLRIISNLEKPDTGNLISDKPYSKKNPVIMVFQDFSLFPHMTIQENIAYGLKMRKVPKSEKNKRTKDLLKWFNIEDKASAFPSQLSAGQQQRVAIARALIVNPMILLLDEPFANLDKNLKMDTALFIKKTQKKFGITTVMVTHDQEEAFFISDRVGILIEGELLQIDKPEIIYHQPVNLNTAKFLGQVNTIPRAYLTNFNISSKLEGNYLLDNNSPNNSPDVSFRFESVSISLEDHGPGEIIESHIWGKTIFFKVRIQDIIIGVYELHSSAGIGDRVSLTLHQIIQQDN